MKNRCWGGCRGLQLPNYNATSFLYHMKPSYKEAIRKEVMTIKEKKIQIIEDGQVNHA